MMMEATALQNLLARFPQGGPPLASVLVQIPEPPSGVSLLNAHDALDAACKLLPPSWQQQLPPNCEGLQSFGDGPGERRRKGFVSRLYFREYTPSSMGAASVHFRDFAAFQNKVDTIRANVVTGLLATFAPLHDTADARRIEKPGLIASMLADVVSTIATAPVGAQPERFGYLGTAVNEQTRVVRREGFRPTVEINGAIGWHIFRACWKAAGARVDREVLRNGYPNDQSFDGRHKAASDLNAKLKTIGLKITRFALIEQREANLTKK